VEQLQRNDNTYIENQNRKLDRYVNYWKIKEKETNKKLRLEG